MGKNKFLALVAAALLLAIPAAFASIASYRPGSMQTATTPSYYRQQGTSAYESQQYSYGAPYIVRSEKKCGDCSRGFNDECQALYTINYYSDGTVRKSAEKTSGFSYCINGRFESFAWVSWFECKNNGYSVAYDKFVSPWGWTMQTNRPAYCQYGCNWSTGKCNPVWTRPASQDYKMECRGNRVVKAYSDGCVITVETCGSGKVCDPVGFRCMDEKISAYTSQPSYREPQTPTSSYRQPATQPSATESQYSYNCISNYSIKLQYNSIVLRQTFCYDGCNKATGQCN